MTTATPPAPGSRRPFSHIDRDGNPKRTFETEHAVTIAVASIEAETGARFTWYVCSQRPQHWHLARIRSRPEGGPP